MRLQKCMYTDLLYCNTMRYNTVIDMYIYLNKSYIKNA